MQRHVGGTSDGPDGDRRRCPGAIPVEWRALPSPCPSLRASPSARPTINRRPTISHRPTINRRPTISLSYHQPPSYHQPALPLVPSHQLAPALWIAPADRLHPPSSTPPCASRALIWSPQVAILPLEVIGRICGKRKMNVSEARVPGTRPLNCTALTGTGVLRQRMHHLQVRVVPWPHGARARSAITNHRTVAKHGEAWRSMAKRGTVTSWCTRPVNITRLDGLLHERAFSRRR